MNEQKIIMNLSIELFFTEKGELKKSNIDWFEGITVEQVLEVAHCSHLVSEGVGIFGKKVSLDTQVHPGDRVEIYQALKIDPKEARRQRASQKSKD